MGTQITMGGSIKNKQENNGHLKESIQEHLKMRLIEWSFKIFKGGNNRITVQKKDRNEVE